jgi:hypothetical protein
MLQETKDKEVPRIFQAYKGNGKKRNEKAKEATKEREEIAEKEGKGEEKTNASITVVAVVGCLYDVIKQLIHTLIS